MDGNVSIFDSLKDNVIVSLKEYKIIDRNDYKLLIIPEDGAWSTIPLENIDVLDYLNTPKSIGEIRETQNEEFKDQVDNLFYCGILSVNDKDIYAIKRNNAHQDQINIPRLWILKYTNVCNLMCKYCYAFDKKSTKKETLSNDYIYKISDLIGITEDDQAPCFCFHGGEPLTRFDEMANCIVNLKEKRKGNIKFSVQTNGTLLTPRMANFFKKEEISVGISIDGHDEESNKLRTFANNRTSVNATLRAIQYCLDEGISPGILSVMTANSFNKTTDLMEKLSSMGARNFHFITFIPSGRGENKVEDYSISALDLLQTRIKMLLFINDYNARKDRKDHISERYTQNLLQNLIQAHDLNYMCAQSPCGSGRRIATLMPNGDIYPCDDFCTDDLFRIGNINEIKDIKSSILKSNAVKLCQSHCVDNILKCKVCLWRKMCISHCCANSYYYTGKFNSPHSSCEFVQQFIPIVIDYLHKGRIQVENILN